MRFFVLFIYVFIGAIKLSAQESIPLNEKTFEIIQPQVSILEDKNYSIEDFFAQKHASKFVAYDSLKVPEGASKYWLMFRVKNQQDSKQKAIVGTNHFDFLTLYYKDSVGNIVEKKAGNLYPNSQKEIIRGGDSYMEIVLLPHQELTCYVEAVNEKNPFFRFVNLNWVIYSKAVFQRHSEVQKIFLYVFLGACVIMLLYNLFLIIVVRERSHVAYVLYNFTVICFVLDTSGEWFEWFDTDAGMQNTFNVYFGTVQGLFLYLFAKDVLQLPKRLPKLNKVTTFFFWSGASTLVFYFFGFYTIHTLSAVVINILGNLLIVWIAITSIIKGYKPAAYFLSGFLIYYISSFIFTFQAYRILPYEILGLIPINLFEISLMLELALFSLTLGYKINVMREEIKQKQLEQERIKREEEAKRLQLIEKQNAELEQKVHERTFELYEKNEEVQQQNEELISMTEELQTTNTLVNEQNIELIEQKHVIETAHRKITDSINYAERIQNAILPQSQKIASLIPDAFVLFRPRDVVSGDFYWCSYVKDKEGNKKVVFATGDCTGHGVPGAFMSMVGADLLAQIVHYRKIADPASILDLLHTGVKELLNQDENENRDGMDISISMVDWGTKTLAYAGAKRPLYYVQNGEMQQIKGDVYPVGGFLQGVNQKFTTHELSFAESPIMAYTFSDGYPDQFGGKEGRKFMTKRFRKMLSEIYDQPISAQEQHLALTLDNWKGDHRQLDDILVVGMRLA